jgi:hypothetical protein
MRLAGDSGATCTEAQTLAWDLAPGIRPYPILAIPPRLAWRSAA